jgi:hypothetical protein
MTNGDDEEDSSESDNDDSDVFLAFPKLFLWGRKAVENTRK